MRKKDSDDSSEFLNVDLDVYSAKPLDSLVAALGETIFVMFVGREGRGYAAHLELAGSGWEENPEKIISRLVSLVGKLPPASAKLWKSAARREFNIGVKAHSTPFTFHFPLQPSTVNAVARVGGSLVVTVYAPKHPRIKVQVPKRQPNSRLHRTHSRSLARR